ncbi:hypothetical protein FA15DRAFT_703942 [Coprinopsis marcescibilis]|uniref:Spindle pole body component n=1 Tax=Coprinopsis marcescibilis TaxID=230819 RepID=A0A5C3KXV7_COPMA|nr:hypothetical protein FA15DRAFT_703942 [Coprinopsis marcescibilis]
MWNADVLDLQQFEVALDDEFNSGANDSGYGQLAPIRPFFFVAPLENKPQDPILHAVKVSEANRNLPTRHLLGLGSGVGLGFERPEELSLLQDLQSSEDKEENIWTDVLDVPGQSRYNNTFSWDRLRETNVRGHFSTPFLTEQDALVFAIARKRVLHKLDDPRIKVAYVPQEEFHQALQLLVIGTSSTLFTWDKVMEKFVQVGLGEGQTGHVVIDGQDEVLSSSVIARFLTIGTLLRRLEEFVNMLHDSTVKAGPTVYAFAHALSTTLVYLRETLLNLACGSSDAPPTALWMKYALHEEVLKAISELHGRTENAPPVTYPPFNPSPIKIISHIYNHLASHYERQSPREILAIFAHILDTSSREYFHHVGIAVGYGGQPVKQPAKFEDQNNEDYYSLDDEGEEEEDISEALQQIQTEFPDFFPKPLLDLLPAAQKSLILLQKAQPDHPLLSSEESAKKRVRWFWAEQAITSVWNELEMKQDVSSMKTAGGLQHPTDVELQRDYPTDIADFRVFDLEPGQFNGVSSLQIVDKSTSELAQFIDKFPAHLPAITPTLPHLTFLVFRKLLDHSTKLSSTLLSLFLSSSGNLNFQLHLGLLRSYLLVTEPAFKSRLLEALFSDSGNYGIDSTTRDMRTFRPQTKPKTQGAGKQAWAVGLSPNLLEREIWPPVGGDLSFFLRTVIVDALNGGKDWDDEEARRKRHVVHAEAIWRIGFAIRDLPTGFGKAKWLDPLRIEALDFLYMDYKPPRSLDVLISGDILLKYQRMGAFILRLLRVESAIKSVFRMSRGHTDPLFQSLPETRKLFLHFRFVAQSFVASLAAYVFDTAIGGNFDPFLARLEASAKSNSSTQQTNAAASNPGFTDVFELATAHSALLDDILSACLLRTGQKGVSELLRSSLEIVLQFCVNVGELHRKRMEEYRAAPIIEDLFMQFRNKMGTLAKVLKGLVDKGPSSSKWPVDVQVGENKPTGGMVGLYHLLLRLDLGEWWASGRPSK